MRSDLNFREAVARHLTSVGFEPLAHEDGDELLERLYVSAFANFTTDTVVFVGLDGPEDWSLREATLGQPGMNGKGFKSLQTATTKRRDFRQFTELDWSAFGGCIGFDHGEEPLISEDYGRELVGDRNGLGLYRDGECTHQLPLICRSQLLMRGIMESIPLGFDPTSYGFVNVTKVTA